MGTIAAIALAIVALLYSLHRLALLAEQRGWIYYRTKRMPPGAGAAAVAEVASIVAPEVEHVVEEQQAERLRADCADTAAGDPAAGPLGSE